ncbi:MAG: ATP-binding protein [Bacteroidetes bacterium]|nr:ATP-binding protein [Bacteroidota bacterium]
MVPGLNELKKIVVIGPESTGKSTLSEQLANALHTVWVPEYARGYLETLGHNYTEVDLLAIAKGQIESENEYAVRANKYLVCDTDLYVLKVWSEASYGRCHKWILEEIAKRRYDLYLLTNIDIPWQEDPLREHPLPHERAYFYNLYRDIVIQSGVPWASVKGNEKERLELATNAVHLLL